MHSHTMRQGHYAHLTCSCGHKASVYLPDLPERYLTEYGWTIRREALERMRCSECGRIGVPHDIRFGWANGDGEIEIWDAEAARKKWTMDS